jgi:hypothetical protein
MIYWVTNRICHLQYITQIHKIGITGTDLIESTPHLARPELSEDSEDAASASTAASYAASAAYPSAASSLAAAADAGAGVRTWRGPGQSAAECHPAAQVRGTAARELRRT